MGQQLITVKPAVPQQQIARRDLFEQPAGRGLFVAVARADDQVLYGVRSSLAQVDHQHLRVAAGHRFAVAAGAGPAERGGVRRGVDSRQMHAVDGSHPHALVKRPEGLAGGDWPGRQPEQPAHRGGAQPLAGLAERRPDRRPFPIQRGEQGPQRPAQPTPDGRDAVLTPHAKTDHQPDDRDGRQPANPSFLPPAARQHRVDLLRTNRPSQRLQNNRFLWPAKIRWTRRSSLTDRFHGSASESIDGALNTPSIVNRRLVLCTLTEPYWV